MPKKIEPTAAKRKVKNAKKKLPPHLMLKAKYSHLLNPTKEKKCAPVKSPPTTPVAVSRVITVEENQSVHILLKVRSDNGQTISAHKQLIQAKGEVFLGKMGAAVGGELINTLNNQIDKGVATYLFLTIREGWNGEYVTFRCSLRRAHSGLPEGKKALVPQYYVHISTSIKTWFEITSMERLPREEMDKLFVLSSLRPIMGVVSSSATMFRVGISK